MKPLVACLAQEARPVEQAFARQLVLPPALAVIADCLLPVAAIDCGILGMEDGDAVLDRVQCRIGIDTDADEV